MIPKVPLLLRQDESYRDAYDPKAMSFGPYHHGKDELKYCQNAKPLALQLFLERSSQSYDFFYTNVVDVINDARQSYHEGSTKNYTDKEFAEMMLLDACFLILFMDIGSQNLEGLAVMYTYLGRLAISMICRDLFLLENQIPFKIIILLVTLRYGDDGKDALSKFLYQTFWGHCRQEKIVKIRQALEGEKKPLSLFDAFRKVLTLYRSPEDQAQHHVNEEEYHPTKRFRTYRSASHLKAKGIHFSPNYQESLEGVQFKSFLFYGKLKLPMWFVSDLSRVFFPNMIAYELCPGLFLEPIVVSYVNFMKSLIDGADDIKVMRDSKILLTSLGDDEEVAKFYRGLHTYGVEEDTRSFKEVRRKIQMHYDSKTKTWMAQFAHIYFSRPWSIIGWISAVVLLALTAAQTHYTIHPQK